ncbi:hypothetical protein KSP40_PGU001760 [Platanthera guangdongensis]|uniref:Uncharacterized protein n=1 Tax=Platanthera guangdongensis TaxID=2320717 RepID=A0ABR2M343_9ASPA
MWIDGMTSSLGRIEYACVCVKVNLVRPLPFGVRVKSRFQNFFQQVEYKVLKVLCFMCGCVGHRQRTGQQRPMQGQEIHRKPKGTLPALRCHHLRVALLWKERHILITGFYLTRQILYMQWR